MNKIITFAILLSMAFSSIASSLKCASKAADVYYGKILKNDYELSVIRSGTNGKINKNIETQFLDNLILSCEKGIENKTYDTNQLWNSMYKGAKNVVSSDSSARAYADAHVEMYEYGKSIR